MDYTLSFPCSFPCFFPTFLFHVSFPCFLANIVVFSLFFFSDFNSSPLHSIHRSVNNTTDDRGVFCQTSSNNQPCEIKENKIEINELKAKLTIVLFELKEKDIKINLLLEQVKKMEMGNTGKVDLTEMTKITDFMESNQEQVILDDSNQKKIEKYEEELNNVRIDFDRLKVEKKESDVAGKNFMERCSTDSMHSALQYSRFQ